jgi:acetyltransferase-like isoleucine patch superfamily enzyme
MNLENEVPAKIASNASISNLANISDSASVWDYSQIRENAIIGDQTVIGSYVYIDANVKIGENCKIQNGALIYDSAVIHDGVFIGPGAILTNDKNPRSISLSGAIKGSADWVKVGVEVFKGASIGAGAICVAPVSIGKWSLVAAGSVVTKDVLDYAVVAGNPARQLGWVGPAGVRLQPLPDKTLICPLTMTKFEVIDNELHEMIS